MGREIVYCEGCGHNLREDDFTRRKARTIDNRPYCTECRPFQEGEQPEPPPRRTSSGKILAQSPQRKSATGPVPMATPPRRSGAASVQSNPLPVIAGVGGLIFIVLIFAVTQGGTPRPKTAEPPPPPLVEIPTYRPPPEPPPRDPPPREPPPPPIRRDPSAPAPKASDPLVAPSDAEKLEAFLVQIRQRIQEDARRERTEEILRMFAAAAKTAGARSAEVEKLKAEYLETLDEPTRRAAMWSDWKITSSTQPGHTGMLVSHGDRAGVAMTHPPDKGVPATLEREVDVPVGKKTTLSFWVACHQQGDFELRVFADGRQLLKEVVGPPASGWRQKTVDLSPFAGRRIPLRLENFPNDWAWESAYWADLKITSD